MTPDYIFDRRTADAFERSLFEQEQRHTIMMGTPINPENDTATITFVSVPRVTVSWDYGYSNCTTNYWAPPPKSDEEQKRAWREYWQGFFKWRGTPYTKLQARFGQKVKLAMTNIPGLRQVQKRAMNPAMRAHRRFISNLSRPSGFLHTRAF